MVKTANCVFFAPEAKTQQSRTKHPKKPIRRLHMSETQKDPNERPILINLEHGESSKAIDIESLIQRRHYQSLRAQIEEHLSALPSIAPCAEGSEEHEQPYGSGWTQFIDGSRGAGKSTFLRSVIELLKNDSELKSKIAFIAVIDPSRIERSEIILLVILQRLWSRVDAVLKDRRQAKDVSLHDEWRKAFKSVAGGLSLFEKNYHPLNDLDPELFMNLGLERADHGFNLRRNLHRLFALACRILRVQGLVFGFDDADTDATHGINLMECIRKYLDTPRVLVLATGDLELYSLLVRQHFAKTVTGKQETALELQPSERQSDKAAQYLRMIDHLEEQYLLKLFPISKRIQLQPLGQLEQHDCYQVTHSQWKKEKAERIKINAKKFIEILIKRGMRTKNKSDIANYTEFLLSQPLRSILQVMAHCAPHLDNPASHESTAWSPALSKELRRSLQALALTGLYKFSVDTDAIAANELPALCQAVFDLSLQDGDLDTAPYLRPMSADPAIQASFAALAAEVADFCARQPGTALRYLLRGPANISLYALAQPDFYTENEIHTFKSYMGIGRKEDSLDWARRTTAVIAHHHSNSKTRGVMPGVIRLDIKAEKPKLTAEAAIKEAIKKTTHIQGTQPLPFFALCMLNVTQSTDRRSYASIFALIGMIEKLLSADSDEEVQQVFYRTYPARTISAPPWDSSLKIKSTPTKPTTSEEISTPSKPTTPEEISNQNKDESIKLWDSIRTWRKSVSVDLSEKILPSSIFIGKVWTRLFSSLNSAAASLRAETDFAKIIEIFTLCVINAFLIEEAEHHLLEKPKAQASLDLNQRTNPKTSAANFVQKLIAIEPKRNSFPFTAIMATCPLLLGLLNSQENYAKALLPLFPVGGTEETIQTLLCSEDHYALMQKLSIVGAKSSTVDTK